MSQGARARFESAEVAVLATVDPDGAPNLVPITFALVDDAIVTAVDHKPKSTMQLRRLDNIRDRPQVGVIVHEYHPSWTGLWWARASGVAGLHPPGSPGHDVVVQALAERYEQYRDTPPEGTAIRIGVTRWSFWSSEPIPEPPG